MKFCDSPIWDANVVYNDPPDLTKCFQNSFLFWLPCFLLWILAPTWIRMVSKTRKAKLRFSSLSVSKLVISVLLIIIEITNLISNELMLDEEKYLVYYITPSILIASYVRIKFIHFIL